MEVVFMRGISGSGKSTYIKKFWEMQNYAVVSADSFFMKPDGKYNFDITLLGQAHKFCMNEFIRHLTENKVDFLIVDNTNTRNKELAPYIKIASVLPYVKLFIVALRCDPQVAFKRNQHGVPLEVIERMQNRLVQNLNIQPAEWPKPILVDTNPPCNSRANVTL